MLEARSKGKTTDALKSLMKLSAKTAVVIREGRETEVPIEQVRQEFGERVATLVYSETSHLPHEAPWRERKQAQVDAIAAAPRDSKIVAIGDKLSNLRTIVADYRQKGDSLWKLFRAPNGKEDVLWYYTQLASSLSDLAGTAAYEEYLELLKEL